jgi:high-affinity nickel permease
MVPPPSQKKKLWHSVTNSPFSSFIILVLGWLALLKVTDAHIQISGIFDLNVSS